VRQVQAVTAEPSDAGLGQNDGTRGHLARRVQPDAALNEITVQERKRCYEAAKGDRPNAQQYLADRKQCGTCPLSETGHPSPRRFSITIAATAPKMTTIQGGTRHMTSSKKATIPRPKSAGPKITLVHTGV